MSFLNTIYEKINQSKVALILSIAIGLFVVIRWYYWIDLYSVNVLYWDQWGFFKPLFTEASLWEYYNYQHGPHKQGLGMLVIALVANFSEWNTRVDSFVIGSFLVLTAFSFLLLKRKLVGKINVFDLTILLLCVSSMQLGVINTPNVAHGVLPAFLLSLACWSLIIKNIYIRYSLFLLLDFLMVYTGFGFFMGTTTIVYFTIKLIWRKNEPKYLTAIGLIFGIVVFTSFFIDYSFSNTINEAISISWYDYLVFSLAGLSKFWNLAFSNTLSIIAGIITLIGTFVVSFKAFNNIRYSKEGQNSFSEIVLILIVFTITFIVFMTYGRAEYGVKTSKALRYAPLIMPIYIAIYLYSYKWIKLKPIIQFALFLMLMISVVKPKEVKAIQKLSNHKKEWVKVYKETGDIETANKKANFLIFQKKSKNYKNLEMKLQYLEKHKLNLFAE